MTKSKVQFLTARYTAVARDYGSCWAPELLAMSLALLQECGEISPRRVLDIGSGVGHLLPHLKDRFGDAVVVGVDRSHGMLELSPPGFSVAVMDANQLGFCPGVFDLVLLNFVLFHLSKPVRGIGEAARVLRPGGTVGCATWAPEPESAQVKIWNEELARHRVPEDPAEGLTRHDLVDTPGKMIALFEAAGLSGARSRVATFPYLSSPENFLRQKTMVGSGKIRLELADPETRSRCIARVKKRLSALEPGVFEQQHTVVLTTATREKGQKG